MGLPPDASCTRSNKGRGIAVPKRSRKSSNKGGAHGPFVEHLVAPVGLQGYQAQGPGLRRGQAGHNPLVHWAHEVRQPDPRQPGFGRGGSRNQHVAALSLGPAHSPFPNGGLAAPRLTGQPDRARGPRVQRRSDNVALTSAARWDL